MSKIGKINIAVPEKVKVAMSGNILNIGDMVENINTGLHGEIIRRGTNYVICVWESGYVFKCCLSVFMFFS